jgi:phosphoadenosine phosphosulfate reductase
VSDVEELQELTRDMDTASFLRFLITERFPKKIVASCSLRARSVVLLKLISDIDPSTPIIFCHAQDALPESLEYRAELVRTLGLLDTRDPVDDKTELMPGDCDHSEGLWGEWQDHTRFYRRICLNRDLADFDCWISGVYHGPYRDTPLPRVTESGRMIRIDPLASWTRDQVRNFMKENGLRYHPRAIARRPSQTVNEEEFAHIYNF